MIVKSNGKMTITLPTIHKGINRSFKIVQQFPDKVTEITEQRTNIFGKTIKNKVSILDWNKPAIIEPKKYKFLWFTWYRWVKIN